MGRKIPQALLWLLLPLLVLKDTAAAPGPDACEAYAAARQRMVAQQLTARDITDPRVLAAMAKVPRDRFVPARLASQAYDDNPLPIGSGQTISQPYIVALMSQWAEVGPGDKVLEVGTGSGYQAAVLAEIAGQGLYHRALAGSGRGRPNPPPGPGIRPGAGARRRRLPGVARGRPPSTPSWSPPPPRPCLRPCKHNSRKAAAWSFRWDRQTARRHSCSCAG